jgi:hypothetical protein
MQTAIHTFVAAFYGGRVDIRDAGDFFGEQMVPEFPASSLGELRSDVGSTATKLALDGNHAEHDEGGVRTSPYLIRMPKTGP